jgi:hypothetical protein
MEGTALLFLKEVWKHHGMCQGTPAAVPTRANIRVSVLNKGGSGDPGARSAVGHTVRGQAVSGIYISGTTDHTICGL